jgi:choice-of-anchor A domain-containing protein
MVFGTVLVLLVGLSAVVKASDLGAASAYNVYVLKDLNQNGGTTQGSIAAGGNASLASVSIGGSASGSTQPALVVGGTLTVTGGGSISNGGIYAGGNTNLPAYYYTNYSVHSNSNSLPMDFSLTSQYLVKESAYLGKLSGTGTVTDSYNKITLTGTNSGVNVFYVSSTQLATAWGLYVDVPTGATAVVNVEGTQVSFKNGVNSADGGYSLDSSRVLYNFYQASEVDLGGINIQGSVLAPNATVNFNGGNFDGTLVAGDLVEQNLAMGYSKFQGNLPTAPVPEPSSAMGFGFGLIGMAGVAWRRLRSSIA